MSEGGNVRTRSAITRLDSAQRRPTQHGYASARLEQRLKLHTIMQTTKALTRGRTAPTFLLLI